MTVPTHALTIEIDRQQQLPIYHLGLSRGVVCLPEQVFVTGGYRATLELVLRSLARPNDRVWYEDPGYLLARGFLAETGVQLVPVPVDGEGIDVERVGRVAHSMNAGSPTLLQAAAADFIEQGHFARHLKRMRALYSERRKLIVHALEQAFGERLIVDLPPGGIQFAVRFADGPDGPVDDIAVAARAREAVLPLSIWYANGRALRGLVMGFANIADAVEAGRLARTLRACLDS